MHLGPVRKIEESPGRLDIEQRLDLSHSVPGVRGTGDAIVHFEAKAHRHPDLTEQ